MPWNDSRPPLSAVNSTPSIGDSAPMSVWMKVVPVTMWLERPPSLGDVVWLGPRGGGPLGQQHLAGGGRSARAHLAEPTVAPEGFMDGYNGAKFPHWITISGTCNPREPVLKRDGDNVRTNAECRDVSGTWSSLYDGATWPQCDDLDIDHMVPLTQAWRSGANTWTTARRRAFANDLTSSQLWTVTDDLNQAKGDKDPALGKPPLASFHCTYGRSWTDVKCRY